MRNLSGSAYDGILTSPIVKEAPVVGANIYTDPTLQDWVDADTLTSWSDGAFGAPGDDDALAREEAVVMPGKTYSAKLITGTANTAHGLGQLQSGLTVGAEYVVKVTAQQGTSTALNCIIVDENILDGASPTVAWDFVLHTYTAVIGGPTGDQVKSLTLDGTWTEYDVVDTSFPVTVPGSGKIFVAFGSGDTAANTAYIGDVKLQSYVSTPVTLFTETSELDATDLDENDTLLKLETTGGADKTHLSYNAAGQFDTDYTRLEMLKPLKVANASAPGDVLSGYTADGLYVISGTIDLKSVANTSFGSAIPTGKTLVVSYVDIEILSATNVTVGPTFALGSSGSTYTNHNSYNHAGGTGNWLAGSRRLYGSSLGVNFNQTRIPETETFGVAVTVASTADAHTAKFRVFGYLV